jgi:DNA repair protein RadC
MHAIEVQVLDHFIIADGFDAYSMAEHQLIWQFWFIRL